MAKKPIREITIDIFKNILVPKSRILNEKEKDALLEKYNISTKQLPVISHLDTVSKKLEAKAGDVIEFERNTKTAGMSKYYRVVTGGGA
jgi:DNA-directed RNA polymerase subunit H (RpoH/RPB5)